MKRLTNAKLPLEHPRQIRMGAVAGQERSLHVSRLLDQIQDDGPALVQGSPGASLAGKTKPRPLTAVVVHPARHESLPGLPDKGQPATSTSKFSKLLAAAAAMAFSALGVSVWVIVQQYKQVQELQTTVQLLTSIIQAIEP